MKYTVSLDTLAVVITTCTTLLFAGAIIWQYTAVQETAMPSIVSLLLIGI
jgi:hypothetical protein